MVEFLLQLLQNNLAENKETSQLHELLVLLSNAITFKKGYFLKGKLSIFIIYIYIYIYIFNNDKKNFFILNFC